MLKFFYTLFCKIFMLERILVNEHERSFLFSQGRLVTVLKPGAYHVWNPFGQMAYEIFDITALELSDKHADMLLKQYPEIVEQFFFVADVADNQVALLTVDGKLYTVLPPAARKLYWNALHDFSIELVNITEQYAIPQGRLSVLSRIRTPHALIHVVPEGYKGLLFIDGQLEKMLEPGLYGFWKAGRDIRCDSVDVRLQQIDVQGQEILTKDRVTLRVTLTCWFVVADPVKAVTSVSKYGDHLYKELQFALREAVGAKVLDDLLSDKDTLDSVILEQIKPKLAEVGMEIRSIGIKDIILPGDMRDIMNKVIEARKLAEANQIQRREETAATRSLLNTAKLMEDKPILLRLKELETLEKISGKIEKLHVYGGFENLLNDLISIKTPEQGKK